MDKGADMLNPFTMSMQLQQASTAGAFCMASMMIANTVKVMQAQHQVVTHAWTPHRAEDETLHPHLEPDESSPDLLYHYGRRSHDVDVEHMR
ncbi:MAG: hypothetical protein H6907_20095 [Hyphomicrobiales bacterium]|nr:hypothetical protein [Hyphomicrobiales bacterium]